MDGYIRDYRDHDGHADGDHEVVEVFGDVRLDRRDPLADEREETHLSVVSNRTSGTWLNEERAEANTRILDKRGSLAYALDIVVKRESQRTITASERIPSRSAKRGDVRDDHRLIDDVR